MEEMRALREPNTSPQTYSGTWSQERLPTRRCKSIAEMASEFLFGMLTSGLREWNWPLETCLKVIFA